MLSKRTRIVLSDKAREKIRLCSSGLRGDEWAAIPMDEKKDYMKKLDLAIEEAMLTEPDSFTRRAIAHAKEARMKRLLRTIPQLKGNVQEEV